MSTTATTLQLEVTGGVPSSKAVLLDSTNFAGASWTSYSSPTVSVNLGTIDGWHAVWTGLRGLPSDAEQT